MKKTFLAFSAIVILSACSKSNADKIIGTWSATSIKFNHIETINLTSATTNVMATFNTNGTGVSMSNASTDNFTYAVNDNTLNIYYTSDTTMFTIQELTDNELKIHGIVNTDTVDEVLVK